MRVSQWAFGPVNGTPEVFPYSYDAANRLTRAGEWDTLTYDANSRLTHASGFGMENSLVHDAYNNNISSLTTSTGFVPDSLNNFTFNPIVDNHLPSLSSNGAITQVSEDNFGEITNVGTAIGSQSPALSMTWDSLGRMTSTTIGATGAVESHGYAASGLRVSRIDSRDANLNRIYAYTGTGHLLAEYTAGPTPAWARDVVYLGDLAIAEIDNNGIHELHADHQGTPRVVTGSSGAVEGRLAYGPYGELLTGTPYVTGYIPLTGYTGHLQTEPTGLIYMRGRFYSPAWHRFMNSNQGLDPNLINQFGYVFGDPLASTDPTGLDVYGPGDDNGPKKGFGPAQSQRGTSRTALALRGVADIGLGCLGLAAAVAGAATVETGMGALVAAAGAIAGSGLLAAGVTEVVGAMTGQTQTAVKGAVVATVVTSASGATTMCVTGGNIQAAQTAASVESVTTGSLSLSANASTVENVANIGSIVAGVADLVGNDSSSSSESEGDGHDHESGDAGNWGHGRSSDTGTSNW